MLGVVLAGNLIQFVIFWELTSLISFLLIGYWHHRLDAQRGARMALIVTDAGGLGLLGGVVILGQIVGSYELNAVLAVGDRIRGHALYPAALVLILLGAFYQARRWRQGAAMSALPHIVVMPVVLPLIAAALLLLLSDKQKGRKSLVNLAASIANLVVAATLVRSVRQRRSSRVLGVELALRPSLRCLLAGHGSGEKPLPQLFVSGEPVAQCLA
jgi:NADH:ubiquinone oxidoreductase subunit 5 (subunit L)/multisubunit Na+/H+ antiporter MnhA subunit